jgi:hypothetical protein
MRTRALSAQDASLPRWSADSDEDDDEGDAPPPRRGRVIVRAPRCHDCTAEEALDGAGSLFLAAARPTYQLLIQWAAYSALRDAWKHPDPYRRTCQLHTVWALGAEVLSLGSLVAAVGWRAMLLPPPAMTPHGRRRDTLLTLTDAARQTALAFCALGCTLVAAHVLAARAFYGPRGDPPSSLALHRLPPPAALASLAVWPAAHALGTVTAYPGALLERLEEVVGTHAGVALTAAAWAIEAALLPLYAADATFTAYRFAAALPTALAATVLFWRGAAGILPLSLALAVLETLACAYSIAAGGADFRVPY